MARVPGMRSCWAWAARHSITAIWQVVSISASHGKVLIASQRLHGRLVTSEHAAMKKCPAKLAGCGHVLVFEQRALDRQK